MNVSSLLGDEKAPYEGRRASIPTTPNNFGAQYHNSDMIRSRNDSGYARSHGSGRPTGMGNVNGTPKTEQAKAVNFHLVRCSANGDVLAQEGNPIEISVSHKDSNFSIKNAVKDHFGLDDTTWTTEFKDSVNNPVTLLFGNFHDKMDVFIHAMPLQAQPRLDPPFSMPPPARRGDVASADISTDNILPEDRRKRARFDSSDLPLYTGEQQQASLSSVSPVRRESGGHAQSPAGNIYQRPIHRLFHPYYSPQSSNNEEYYKQGYRQEYPEGYRSMPTPDPSLLSTEDAARGLLALSNPASIRGRTSTSTVDETFSHKVDFSADEGSDDEDDNASALPATLPYDNRDYGRASSTGPNKRAKIAPTVHHPSSDALVSSEEDNDDKADESFKESDGLMGALVRPSKPKLSKSKASSRSGNHKVTGRNPSISSGVKKARADSVSLGNHASLPPVNGNGKLPIAPNSVASGASRKGSSVSSVNFHHTLGPDEEDLSTKPRCQRCRKSKKGCDRQRPCQRCKDAGLGIDDCVSEDEGNGRKGRYGRLMGVAVKKASISSAQGVHSAVVIGFSAEDLADDASVGSGSQPGGKKRKRV